MPSFVAPRGLGWSGGKTCASVARLGGVRRLPLLCGDAVTTRIAPPKPIPAPPVRVAPSSPRHPISPTDALGPCACRLTSTLAPDHRSRPGWCTAARCSARQASLAARGTPVPLDPGYVWTSWHQTRRVASHHPAFAVFRCSGGRSNGTRTGRWLRLVSHLQGTRGTGRSFDCDALRFYDDAQIKAQRSFLALASPSHISHNPE